MHGDDFDARVIAYEYTENLISKGLTNCFDITEVQPNLSEFVHAGKQSLRLRS